MANHFMNNRHGNVQRRFMEKGQPSATGRTSSAEQISLAKGALSPLWVAMEPH
ncbi:hypothetical protein T4B_869 [Trichinella pseudospiralis]|uniref:Uncharacterized protein n=2 Tax=Trichinella pseudospiralis TaxID=6337 RepID=A0A0V0YM89_TRIPS|nr:hypothetical protein T4E_9966 [Trichinella pseudospiralis]KRY72915.1 hypothetical protein T4A_8188 [Trichinella pseudospiralis]KRY92573.1 hypothetical protein T4D_13237 [Trichinella pseudospiralis]KRZ35007.1 hypothetical protein T4B_869 [Trichinella pseudospiralis]KRZ44167.1 hypothetical protein T4C_5081 [Trichinella pseudospiralis]